MNLISLQGAFYPQWGGRLPTGASDDAEYLDLSFAQAVRGQYENTANGQSRWQSRLAALEQLAAAVGEAQEENWDGYGGRPAARHATADAALFLIMLPLHLPIPEVQVDPDGDVGFDWESRDGSCVMLSLHGKGVIYYAARFSSVSKLHGTEQIIEGKIPDVILHCLNRLFAHDRSGGRSR